MEFQKIYVLCPVGIKTGGPELLHQLVYQINKISDKGKATIAYIGDPKRNKPVAEYKKYIGNDWIRVNQIDDKKENLIIFPETFLSMFDKYKYSIKYIWWLSVDNYLNGSSIRFNLESKGLFRTAKAYLRGAIKGYTKQIKSADKNLCQSYYAEEFLRNKYGILDNRIVYLSDYINDLYVNHSDESLSKDKQDIVLYNPKKGLEFTRKIIEKSKNKNWKWVPLIGLKNEQVKEYLETSKVYIDFGNHPGKDRFPREAAILGCCVITDKRGAANYFKDVPIADKYKYEDNDKNIPEIIQMIEYCIKNYSIARNDFEDYREYIKSEKAAFTDDVVKIFGEKKNQ